MLDRLFARIVALRTPLLVAWALATAVFGALAARIPNESGIGRLIVPDDPDAVATRAFQQIFPEGAIALALLEAPSGAADPFSPEALSAFAAAEQSLRGVPHVQPFSALDAYRRAHPGFVPDAAGAAAFKRFATGTAFFRKQGLVGDRFLGLVLSLEVRLAEERDAALAAIDARLPKTARKVGMPYVESWIERQSAAASTRYFPVFFAFVIAIALFLYRSWRTLVALLLALGAAVAAGVGVGRLFGYPFTLVSALVPLTILVTTLASLVYLHSRYVDSGLEDGSPEAAIFALRSKYLPISASALAAVLGFAALAVSKIKPVREMGLWTAAGLAISWLAVFTLFPALQVVLRTPTGRAVAVRSALYDAVAAALPGFTRRHRASLVALAVALSAAGLVALFGFPPLHLPPMSVGVDALDYVDPREPIARDLRFFRDTVSGLNVARVWVRFDKPVATEPDVLRALDAFQTAVEKLPDVASVVGPTTFLRMRRYLAGGPDALPEGDAAFDDVEQLLLTEGELKAFLDAKTLQNAQLTVVFNHGELTAYHALAAELSRAFAASDLPKRGATMQVVGEALLNAKIGGSLVPTLAESFALTAALIFVVFLFLFRSASARLMAMLPSVFAILVTFLGMRLLGASLNVATILIATTVLGTTENDQIHFFHHLHEKDGAPMAEALAHALRVSGRAIVFATLINAAGFLALALSSFPPLRQFGLVTAAAFALALLADFTALPAALWLKERAGAERRSRG